MSQSQSEVAKLYFKLEADRLLYLDRARQASLLTIPSIFPPSGSSSATDFVTPYQSVGARGVNNLASKLLLTLLPTNNSFFQLTIDDFDLAAIDSEAERGKVEEGLARIERSAQQEIDARALRVPTFEAIKHLLISGNSLLYLPKKGSLKVYKLDQYVIDRSTEGQLNKIIIKETTLLESLPDSIRTQVLENGDIPIESNDNDSNPEVTVFTCVNREGKKFRAHQEVEGIVIPQSESVYPEDRMPYLALRFTAVDGEHYGRGFIEEYYGDLNSLEILTKAIVQGSAAAAKVLFLVNPNGTTKKQVLADSPNGAIADGNAQDVSVLQLEKFNDFRIAQETSTQITERLSFAFLLNSAVQRNAERVTAEEIRFMAQELEAALGGVYSTLSQEFQLPLVKILLKKMEDNKKMPKFPEGVLKPKIMTGLGALGRSQDLGKLMQFVEMAKVLSDPTIAGEINIADALSRVASSLDMDTQGLIKSAEQKAEEQAAEQEQMQQMQQAEMGGKAIAPAINAMSKQQQGG